MFYQIHTLQKKLNQLKIKATSFSRFLSFLNLFKLIQQEVGHLLQKWVERTQSAEAGCLQILSWLNFFVNSNMYKSAQL